MTALTPHLPLPLGSLRVWGDWFGKPLDNQHVAVAARHDGEQLIVEFHHREVLRVVAPGDWTFDLDAPVRESRFIVRRAERVEWGWFYYGRPQLPENWFEVHHWQDDGRIRASTTWTPSGMSFAPSTVEPAVMFL